MVYGILIYVYKGGTSTLPHLSISSAKPPHPTAYVGTWVAHATGWRSIGATTATVKGQM